VASLTVPDGRFAAGARLAVTTFTVVPLRAGRVDRPAAAVAMSLAPAVGAALGLALGGALLGLGALGAPALLGGSAVVALGALTTRGLHLDGLADTVDAVGSYRSGEAALAIMKKPDVGPFGATALVLVLLTQAAALAALVGPDGRGWPATLATVVAATATGRLAAGWACRRGVPAARPDGLGAMVAGTVGPAALAAGTAAVAVLAVPAVPGRPWQGPVAAVAALAVVVLLQRHLVRRLGGITGDVLGACVEAGTTLTYLGLLLAGPG
jgi:adenosylcobinamide-GDP ribazoletransferase